MIEPECAFADLNDNMDLAEDMLKYVIRYVLENAPEEMNFFNSFIDKGLLDRLNHVVDSEFGHVTYTEAIELLEKNNDKFDYKVFWLSLIHIWSLLRIFFRHCPGSGRSRSWILDVANHI